MIKYKHAIFLVKKCVFLTKQNTSMKFKEYYFIRDVH